MYDSVTEFMTTFSADHPLLWALLVMGVVAVTSMVLFVLWEMAFRIFPATRVSRKNGSHLRR